MVLDHSTLGKQIRPNFLRSISLLYKIALSKAFDTRGIFVHERLKTNGTTAMKIAKETTNNQ